MSFPDFLQSIIVKIGKTFSFDSANERMNQVGSDGYDQTGLKNYSLGATSSSSREANLYTDGNCVFLDTVSGNDANSGLTRLLPKLTYSSAATAASGAARKAIVVINSAPTISSFAGTDSDEITVPLIMDKGISPGTIQRSSGALALSEATTAPTGRPSQRHGFAFIRHHNYSGGSPTTQEVFYLYGGLNSSTYYSNFYKYDPTTDTYSTISPATSPGVRYAGRFALCQNLMFLHGGKSAASTYLSNLYKYTGSDFSLVATTGDTPAARAAHGFCGYAGKIFCYGGIGASGATLTDFYCLDPNTLVWTQINNTLMPDVGGSCRLEQHAGYLWLIGKSSTSKMRLWRYNERTGWEWYGESNVGSAGNDIPDTGEFSYTGIGIPTGTYLFYGNYLVSINSTYTIAMHDLTTGIGGNVSGGTATDSMTAVTGDQYPHLINYGEKIYALLGYTASFGDGYFKTGAFLLKNYTLLNECFIQGFSVKAPIVTRQDGKAYDIYDCTIYTETQTAGDSIFIGGGSIEIQRCKFSKLTNNNRKLIIYNASLKLCESDSTLIPFLHLSCDFTNKAGGDAGYKIYGTKLRSIIYNKTYWEPLVYSDESLGIENTLIAPMNYEGDNTLPGSGYAVVFGQAAVVGNNKRFTIIGGLYLYDCTAWVYNTFIVKGGLRIDYGVSDPTSAESSIISVFGGLDVVSTFANNKTNIYTANQLFKDSTDYKLKALVNGDGIDSTVLTIGPSYTGTTAGSGAVTQNPTEIGAYINHYAAASSYYARSNRFIRPNSIRTDIKNSVRQNPGLDGTIDVYNNPEKRFETITLTWEHPFYRQQDISFVDYMDSLQDTSAELALDPAAGTATTATTSGSSAANQYQITLDGSTEVPEGALVEYNGQEYNVCSRYPVAGNTDLIVVEKPLVETIPDAAVLTVSDISGLGEYSYLPPDSSTRIRVESQSTEFISGYEMKFTRKKQ